MSTARGRWGDAEARAFLRRLFDAAVAAAHPARVVPPALPCPARGRNLVIGAGKAAAAMARAVEEHWRAPIEGLVITRYGHAAACRRIRVVEAGHPVPDEASLAAARETLALASALGEEDLALCLLSGGGSALLALPAPGLALADKRALTRALLRSGAGIGEINTVRKHLSAIKGGRLAGAAWPASTLTLAISDVPGDEPAVIASGPTVPDPTTAADARAVLTRYRIVPPAHVAAHLESPAAETPKPGDARLARTAFRLIATASDALSAAERAARAEGTAVLVMGDDIQGEARRVAGADARTVTRILAGRGPVHPPAVLLAGGETTVTVRGHGRGGRNGEYALALAIALEGRPGVWALACDTDGIDGTEDNAGAVIGPRTLARARAAGLDAERLLADNDTYRLFAALGDLVTTGPTRTNVNDFRAILVAPGE